MDTLYKRVRLTRVDLSDKMRDQISAGLNLEFISQLADQAGSD